MKISSRPATIDICAYTRKSEKAILHKCSFLAYRPVGYRNIHPQAITSRECEHLNVMLSNKYLDLSKISIHLHFEVRIAGPVVMMIHDPHAVKPQWPNNLTLMRILVESASFLTHPCKQIGQQALMIHLLVTMPELQNHLFANTTTVKNFETAPVILALRSTGDMCVTTFSKTFPHLRFFAMSPHSTEVNHIENSQIPGIIV